MPVKQIQIILTEDHHVVRNGIRSMLEQQPDITVTGEAMNGQGALDLLEGGSLPDIIITDINMPGMDGLELTAQLKNTAPGIKVVILSMLDNDKYVAKAFNAGAWAYLLKNVSPEEMLFAIRQVHSGEQYICGEIAMRLVKRLVKVPELPLGAETADLELSERDTEVLRLIAAGYTNQEIGDMIFAGKRTVEGYRQNLMNRTGSRNTAALIKFAIINHLID